MEVKVSYQTLHLPPPFAYAYTLEIGLTNGSVLINFQQEYLNREAITQQEIIDEGFTPDDDFKWQGALDHDWFDYLKQLFTGVKFKRSTDEDHTWIYLSMKPGSEGHVDDLDFWEYELQEIIQAIFEKAGKENKLNIELIHHEDSHQTSYSILGSFAKRKALINQKEISWDSFRQLMSDIFSIELPHESKQKPHKNGWWIRYDQETEYYHLKSGKRLSMVSTLIEDSQK